MENKKNSILIVITLIVILILCGGIAYLAFNLGKESANNKPEINDKTENKEEVKQEETQTPSEDKKEEVSNETIDYNKFIAADSKILKTDEKEIIVNGNKHKITYIYSYKSASNVDSSVCGAGDDGIGCDVNTYYITVLQDGKITKISNLEISETDPKYPPNFDSNDKWIQVKTLKDTINNKEYIAMAYMSRYDAGGVTHTNYYVYILDENNNVIHMVTGETYCDVDINGKIANHVDLFDNHIIILDTENSGYKIKATMQNGSYKTEKVSKIDSSTVSGSCPEIIFE